METVEVKVDELDFNGLIDAMAANDCDDIDAAICITLGEDYCRKSILAKFGPTVRVPAELVKEVE
tara:strand:+ start:1681 stop:1875 length:195 start_codon:yes stop_codon:yes gene_type:complete